MNTVGGSPLSSATYNRLSSYFKKRAEVIAVYLFGSQARGAVSSLSDIDLALLLSPSPAPESRLSYRYEAELLADLTSLLKTENIDLVVLNQASPLLQHRVLRDRQLLYCRNHVQRLRLEFRMLQEYLDLQPFYARQSRSLLQRIREGRFATPETHV